MVLYNTRWVRMGVKSECVYESLCVSESEYVSESVKECVCESVYQSTSVSECLYATMYLNVYMILYVDMYGSHIWWKRQKTMHIYKLVQYQSKRMHQLYMKCDAFFLTGTVHTYILHV